MSGKQDRTATAIKYFLSYPGQHVTVEDLCEELDATPTQAMNAVTYILRNDRLPGLKVVQSGHVWSYEPKQEARHTMNILGEGSDGTMVLQDVDGSIWVARKAKF